jgi:MtN3 and saliva related transmembrane protein
MNVELIGYLAGASTTVSFVPQVLQVVKTKSTKDISLIMFTIFSIGVFSWMVYGLLVHSIPMILFNALTFVQALVILCYKIIYK